MAQQSQNAWQSPANQPETYSPHHSEAAASGQALSVGQWMHDVLGQQPAPNQAPVPGDVAAPTPVASPPNDLQSRLAAIAKNIETLESRVTGEAAGPSQPSAPRQTATMPAAHTPAEPNRFDPLEALRRRKHELDHGAAPQAEPATPSVEPPSPAVHAPVTPASPQPHPAADQPSPAPATGQSGLDQSAPDQSTQDQSGFDQSVLDALVARLDGQFARLSEAVGDVRSLAETSAQGQANLHEKVAALQSQMDAPIERQAAQEPSAPTGNPAWEQISDQVRAIQNAIATMPQPEAIQSLEDGYRHVLSRLDGLKDVGASDEKIDGLYKEVTSLRELLDNLGESNVSALVGEMRAMITQMEADPHGNAGRIAEALESVKDMARGATQDPAVLNDAIGAVVERLVALEARIEALANGTDDGPVAQRLDAIQSQMDRLATFQTEAQGLTSAIDTIREEMRASAPTLDLTAMDQRFSALDRIEEMTGGYAAQVAELSQRLNALDGRLASQADMAVQADMANEIAALSQRMDRFNAAMPVHEIEHALLDLTGRVTALQEDTATERLGMAVRELGERVESCLKSIPKTEAIIQAVEANIDSRLSGAIDPVVSRLDGMDERLSGIQRAISAADAPLIDHLSNRLEGLIAAMPTPRADVALASLESQLVELNKHHAEAGIVSREDVTRLHSELARARASVELGSNRDLQRAIVDQVRHLAGRFDEVRATGDAGLLPEIETQIDDLAGRVHALGLFDPQSDPVPVAGVDAVQSELVALRQHASEQDQRMLETLESVQNALETVVGRLDALEVDDQAARSLSAGATAAKPASAPRSSPAAAPKTITLPSLPTHPKAPPTAAKKAEKLDKASAEDAPQPSAPTVEPTKATPSDRPLAGSQDSIPAPGDAQTLLRQLSGAINAAPDRPTATPKTDASGSEQALPEPETGSSDAANQRASFIAAARRAAQAAALQAGGGTPAQADTNIGGARPGKAAFEPLAGDAAHDGLRQEPQLGDSDAIASTLDDDPMELLSSGGRSAQKQKGKAKDEKGQRALSRAMVIALILFTVGLGIFVVNLILPTDRAGDAIVAPIVTPQTPQEETNPTTNDLGATTGETTGDGPARVVGSASVTPPADEAFEARPEPTDAEVANAPETAGTGIGANDVPARSTPVGTGFERDRGPVMAETPQRGETALGPVAAADPGAVLEPSAPQNDLLPPPANDLGPLLNLPIPTLPVATADALPEAIGTPRLRVAAAGGDSAAAFEVATRFMEGRFLSQDLAAAAHWYGRAADHGVIPAAYRLGSFYEQGRGVDRDRDAAIAWYERAALGGNPRAMHNLAVMAAEGAGQEPDFSRAAGWFIPAANRGLTDSQFNLAVLFARGMGVERDLMESYKWFALAANGGDSEAVARRDEVAGVLGEQALALAQARVDNWRPVPVEPGSVTVEMPSGGWDDGAESAAATPTQVLIAEAQSLLADRGYNPGPADGLVGPRTSEAVRAFRQSVGLGDSEVIDQALLDALRQGTSL